MNTVTSDLSEVTVSITVTSDLSEVTVRGAQPSSAAVIPGDPNLPRGTPLGVVVYGGGGGGTPTPCGQNSRPSLPMTPISPLICTCPHFHPAAAYFPAPGRSRRVRHYRQSLSAARGSPRPIHCPTSPPPSSNSAPTIPRSTRRSGDGQRRQPVVYLVEAMGGAVYIPKNPGVKYGDLIKILDVAVEGWGWSLTYQDRGVRCGGGGSVGCCVDDEEEDDGAKWSGWSHPCAGDPNHHQQPLYPGTQICLGVSP